jgi:hypothetical protein
VSCGEPPPKPRAAGAALALIAAVATSSCDDLAGLDDLAGRESRPRGATLVWARHYAFQGPQRLGAMALDREGNVYLAGATRGPIDFGGGPLASHGLESQVFVAKLTPGGDHVWSQQFGEARLIRVHDVAVSDAGAVALAGAFIDGTLEVAGDVLTSQSYDGVVALLGADGALVWGRRVGPAGNQEAVAVCFTKDRLDVAGTLAGSVSFSDPFATVTLPEEGTSSAHVWLASYHPEGTFGADAVLVEGSRWVSAQRCHDDTIAVAGTAAGDVDVLGVARAGHGETDLFIAKLTEAREHLWSAVWGDSGRNCHDRCEVRLATADDGAVVVAGTATGEIDFGSGASLLEPVADVFVAKLGASGEQGAPYPLWSRVLGGDLWEQRVHDVTLDRDGNVVVAGRFNTSFDMGGGSLGDATDFARDVFVGSLSGATGEHRWSHGLAITSEVADVDPDDPGLVRVAVADDGDVILALSLRGHLEAFGHSFESADGDDDYDVVVLRIKP